MIWEKLLVVFAGCVCVQSQVCHNTCTTQSPQPVCGSDDRTYSNLCLLNVAICYAKQRGVDLSLAHYGVCGMPLTVAPPQSYSCGDVCDEEFELVCGTDARTYHNRCFLQQAMCEGRKTGNYINMAHMGECTEQDVNCPQNCDDHIEPVCSTGNVTFKNPCWLNFYGCRYSSSQFTSNMYHLLHNGTCEGTDPYHTTKIDCSGYMQQGSIAIEGSSGHVFNCPVMERSFLCGADHVTYPGPCAYCKIMDSRNKLDAKNMVDIVSQSPCRQMIG